MEIFFKKNYENPRNTKTNKESGKKLEYNKIKQIDRSIYIFLNQRGKKKETKNKKKILKKKLN